MQETSIKTVLLFFKSLNSTFQFWMAISPIGELGSRGAEEEALPLRKDFPDHVSVHVGESSFYAIVFEGE